MEATIIVQNLKCGGCAKTISSKLGEIENINEVKVFPNSSTVSFNYEDVNDKQKVVDRLKSLGYPSVDSKNSVISKAKSFVSCASGKISQ